MLDLKYSSRFKKDLKYYKYEGKILIELRGVLNILVKGGVLPDKYFNRSFKGEFKDCFKCHVKPDVVLVYRIKKLEPSIFLLRVGSPSNVF